MELPKIGRAATSALHHAGIYTLEQVSEHTQKEIVALHGVGPKAIRILSETLEEASMKWKG
ncbi:hypothetical protein ACE1TF_14030 [Geomicrobium sp. JSM 1781026]|uniref:hypothetical protein n=1 Tax=Geomicrobium sp. JSM 1781026 TaxID=3344580 RepID=UPI0035C0BAD7